MVLKCFLLLNAPASYSNLWWRDALVKSVEINGDHQLQVLNEEHFDIDVVKPTPSRYIDIPVLREGIVLADGFYNLNIQTSSKMFAGWMHVSGDTAIWWGQGNGDAVYAGYAGDYESANELLIDEHNRSIFAWHHAASYSDNFENASSFNDIIRI